MKNLFSTLGPMRVMLALLVLLTIISAPLADGQNHLGEWRFFPSVFGPALTVLLVFVLPLDMTMSRIFMQDAPDPERQRYRRVIRIELVLMGAMILAWIPFFFRVLAV